jgi:2-keto-4-pentenoate hydratase/2-oxohepta-3-ene-1,7-dioic acid hydratase in catechol pathway
MLTIVSVLVYGLPMMIQLRCWKSLRASKSLKWPKQGKGRATLVALSVLIGLMALPQAAWASPLEACLAAAGLPRIARTLDPQGNVVYALVESSSNGIPTSFAFLADADSELADVFDLADSGRATDAARWTVSGDEVHRRVCAPLAITQDDLDAERTIIVAAGLNYAEHAAEAGGGETFLFPKPSEPATPYGELSSPAEVLLLDYEVELGFVLLNDVDLRNLPSDEQFLKSSAFFVANDVTDREPIVRRKALFGMGTGFVEAKGKPGFFPAGPWMVRGSDLFRALSDCAATGLTLTLEVDEGAGFELRQNESSSQMDLKPLSLLAAIADYVAAKGVRSEMSVERARGEQYFPMAFSDEAGPTLRAGTVVLTGTPAGVAMQAPESVVGLVFRGLSHLRGPLSQFRAEQLEIASAKALGGYLKPGDRVRASISGLGSQLLRVAAPGARSPLNPCAAPAAQANQD